MFIVVLSPTKDLYVEPVWDAIERETVCLLLRNSFIVLTILTNSKIKLLILLHHFDSTTAHHLEKIMYNYIVFASVLHSAGVIPRVIKSLNACAEDFYLH